jgi:hypothetical protein
MVIPGPWDRPLYYVLDPDHRVLPVEDVLAWAEWMEHADRRVAEDTVEDYWVSTVFLGVDHGFFGRLLVFETMIFKQADHEVALSQFQNRYGSWDEAVAGHREAVALVRSYLAARKQA